MVFDHVKSKTIQAKTNPYNPQGKFKFSNYYSPEDLKLQQHGSSAARVVPHLFNYILEI